MTYDEENYVLDTLMELQEKIRDMPLEQLIKVINTWIKHHPQENANDFDMNVIANLISNIFDIKK